MKARVLTIAGFVLGLHACSSDSPAGPATEVLPETVGTLLAAVEFLAAGPIPIVGSCAGDTPMNCPGGVLARPVNLNLTAGVPTYMLGAQDFFVSRGIVSATGIPLTIPGVGACTLNINTAPGASAFASLAGRVMFASESPGGPVDRVAFSNLALTNVESSDVTITGSIGCAMADAYVGLMLGTLVDQLTDYFTEAGDLCGAPGPALLGPCPSSGVGGQRR